MRISCCANCKERHDGCHDMCIRFFAESMARELERNTVRKNKLAEQQVTGFVVANIRRDKKKRRAV